MRIHSKVRLAGLASAMLMAIAVGSASARNFSISNQQIRATFISLELGVEGLPPGRCDVILEGSFHARTMPKVNGSLIGYITRITTGTPCTFSRFLNLPWHIRYVGFSGTLPDITSLTIKISRFAFEFGTTCLAEPELEVNLRREAGGRITEAGLAPALGFPLRGILCPAVTGSLRAPFNGTVTLLGNSNDITVTLI